MREYVVFGMTRQIKVWPDRCGCAGETEALANMAAREQRTLADQVQAEYDNRLKRAGLVDKLSAYTFDTFNDRDDWNDVTGIRARVKAYANTVTMRGFCNKPWLILHGKYGTGKSHLAGAIIRQAIDAGIRDCYFRVWTRYLARLKATWDRQKGRGVEDEFGAETEAEIVSEMTRGQVVVIDDLDKREDPSPWVRSVLFDVLNTRYNAMLPTVLTFNHDLDDRALEDHIGGALLDRIAEQAYDAIEFTGPSYRTNIPLVVGDLNDLARMMRGHQVIEDPDD